LPIASGLTSRYQKKLTNQLHSVPNTHSWKKPAILILICNSLFIFSSSFKESRNVLGSMFGKILIANGSANSMKGISTNMLMGTNRNTSVTVLKSCLRSRLLKVFPRRVRPKIWRAVRMSAASSLLPIQ